MLRQSQACFQDNYTKLSGPSSARVSKKTELLNFWKNISRGNPLNNAIRNLSQVALVISLYMMGDIDLSLDGRAAYLLNSARSLNVHLTADEAQAAVASADPGLMMAPMLVAFAHSPLALLGHISYTTPHYQSRLPLLEMWRDLGNKHRLDLLDPLGRLEVILWRLIFRLALGQFTELQLLELFYKDDYVSQIIASEKHSLHPGYGLRFPGDQLEDAVETIEISDDEDQQEDQGEHVMPLRDKPAAEPEPPLKKRRTKSPVSGNAVNASAAVLQHPPQGALRKNAPTLPCVTIPSRTTVRKTGGDLEAYNNLRWLAVSKGWKIPLLREAETLFWDSQDPEQVLDPTVLHDLTSPDFTVEIEYWKFAPAPDNPSDPLVATRHEFFYRPFHETRSDSKYLRAIVASQPRKTWKSRKVQVPLHVHPDAQKFRIGDHVASAAGLPLKDQSLVYVVHEDTWMGFTPAQHQAILRTRAVLIIHKSPYLHDGEPLAFDEEGLEAFTHLDRLAFIQDLGARESGQKAPLQVGRPRDLLTCSKIRLERNSTIRKDLDPVSQRLNLLANTMPSKSLDLPPGWIGLATHEFACNWLENLSNVPEFVFPWKETNWTIFANGSAVTWIHTDVLFTVVTLPVGEKLWFLGRRRPDLPPDDLRGNIRSRSAFDSFNGYTDMSDAWVFEQVHLSPYTTLYMPASVPHCVISLTDCIGAGRHGIPASNISHCVFVTLHNTVLSSSTTNADHEPARRFLIRIFIFIVLAIVDPQNGDYKSSMPRTSRMKAHLPDLTTEEGVLDILALRSFVVLFLALNGSGYSYRVDRTDKFKRLLPLDDETAKELSLAWKLAHDLDAAISSSFTFSQKEVQQPSLEVRAPSSFTEAADIALITMAASMHRYLSETLEEDKEEWPQGFNPAAFKVQAKQMLVLFELHQSLDPELREAQLFADPVTICGTSDKSLSTEFARAVSNENCNYYMLQPWDSASLPFSLTIPSSL
ncbi:hypothetical protein MSAN_01189000 [Mycena sanguinolenta]|uniref:JmjC domain-containing protein n=1 Tax=Mycena sanguinolenta TaxID=230812 RepID=A0A8H7D463_9AGAR|nr:hypothetical protein MSAN_01189000 [Mycena sanguinolenta]